MTRGQPPDLGPPGPGDGDGRDEHPATASQQTADDNNSFPKSSSTSRQCRCAYGETCVCDYYSYWQCDWPSVAQDLLSQCRRRHEAALRLPPLESGRRDPISGPGWAA